MKIPEPYTYNVKINNDTINNFIVSDNHQIQDFTFVIVWVLPYE